jgi:hypothetical protein
MQHPAHTTPVHWIWRQIAFTLPADWEMLQFSLETGKGRCAFADRYGFRAELSWSQVRGEPDYDRMVSDYLSRLEREKQLTEPERLKKAGWHGFSGILRGELSSRFGHYLPAPVGCLVEWVLIWPNRTRDPALEQTVLASTAPAPCDDQAGQRWRAFGLDLRIPPGAVVEACTAHPARTEFHCTDPHRGDRWTFRRFGMVPTWFRGDLEAWMRSQARSDTRELRFRRIAHPDGDALRAEGAWIPRSIHLRKGRYTATAWIDPRDGRLYHEEIRLRRPAPAATTAAAPDTPHLRAAPDFSPTLPPITPRGTA